MMLQGNSDKIVTILAATKSIGMFWSWLPPTFSDNDTEYDASLKNPFKKL